MVIEPGEVLERYKVEGVLGQGGMAVVYRVRHLQLDSLHALKILTVGSEAIKERLVQEGKVQASLRHPNIVAVTDVLEIRGAPGLVMEFIEGPGLDDWLQENRPDVADAVAIFEAICLGVSHAHATGVIHRDLKPANVMMAPASGMWVPKVADFGLAKAISGDDSLSKTRSGMTMGTPQYMAPEQIRDAKNVDERADVFSLGCILYELVAGHAPFEGPDILSIFNAVASGSYVPVTDHVPSTPANVQRAIEGALAVDRDARFHSVDEMLTALRGGEVPERATGGAGSSTWAPQDAPRSVARPVTIGTNSQRPSPVDVKPSGSSQSLAPTARLRRRVAVAVVLTGLVGGAVSVALGLGLGWHQTVETRIEGAIGELQHVSVGAVALGVGGLELTDLVLEGPDGAVALKVQSVRLVADPTAFRGRDWVVNSVELRGLSGQMSRESGETFAGLFYETLQGGSAAGVRVTAGQWNVEQGSVSFSSPGASAEVSWGGLELRDFVLDARGTRTSQLEVFDAREFRYVTEGASVGAARASLQGGLLRVTDIDMTLAADSSGHMPLPPHLANRVARWAGGELEGPLMGEWWGADASTWPARVASVAVEGGTLRIGHDEHLGEGVLLDLAIDQWDVGPIEDGAIPLTLRASRSGGRVELEGRFNSDRSVVGTLVVRDLPVDASGGWVQRRAEIMGVSVDEGTLGLEVSWSAQATQWSAEVSAGVDDLKISPGNRGSSSRIRRLVARRGSFRQTSRMRGSMERAFSPVGEILGVVNDSLFGGGLGSRRGTVTGPAPTPDAPVSPGTEPAPTKPEPVQPAPERPKVGELLDRVNKGVEDAIRDLRREER